MVAKTPKIATDREITKLRSLIPDELQATIAIEPTTEVQPQLISTCKLPDRRCKIQIDLLRWQSVDRDLRNLLFWHEVASIQNGSIRSNRSLYIAIVTGLGIASLDLFAQNIGLLAAALLVAGLAGFRLYQKSLGEENIQRLTAADRDAIELAVKFGYDRQTARELLKLAIQTTTKKSQHKLSRNRATTRLQVLSLS
jgi:hypothetical protein